MEYGFFNMRSDVNACDCARGCANTVREFALQDHYGRKKISCRTRESNLRRRRTGPMLFQLSYIPTILHPQNVYVSLDWTCLLLPKSWVFVCLLLLLLLLFLGGSPRKFGRRCVSSNLKRKKKLKRSSVLSRSNFRQPGHTAHRACLLTPIVYSSYSEQVCFYYVS